MTMEKENQYLREQVAQPDARIQQQDTLLCQQSLLMRQTQAQIATLTRAGWKTCKIDWPKIATRAACPPPRIALCGSQKACVKRARRNPAGKRDTRERPCGFPTRPMK